MKKLLIAAVVALGCATTSVVAQERVGGVGASGATIGGIATGTIVAGSVAAGVVAAVVSNNRSSTVETTTPPVVQPCLGTDPLIGGVCVGTTNTVTTSGTTTVTVPVTFTYAPAQ